MNVEPFGSIICYYPAVISVWVSDGGEPANFSLSTTCGIWEGMRSMLVFVLPAFSWQASGFKVLFGYFPQSLAPLFLPVQHQKLHQSGNVWANFLFLMEPLRPCRGSKSLGTRSAAIPNLDVKSAAKKLALSWMQMNLLGSGKPDNQSQVFLWYACCQTTTWSLWKMFADLDGIGLFDYFIWCCR